MGDWWAGWCRRAGGGRGWAAVLRWVARGRQARCRAAARWLGQGRRDSGPKGRAEAGSKGRAISDSGPMDGLLCCVPTATQSAVIRVQGTAVRCGRAEQAHRIPIRTFPRQLVRRRAADPPGNRRAYVRRSRLCTGHCRDRARGGRARRRRAAYYFDRRRGRATSGSLCVAASGSLRSWAGRPVG